MNTYPVYRAIDEYFDHPKLTKVRNDDQWSTYMAKTTSHLVTVHRYIIALVPKDIVMIGQQVPLAELKWSFFQTRALPHREPYDTNMITYRPKRGGVFSTPISKSKQTDNFIEYTCTNLPIHIVIFPQEEHISFPQHAELNSALETYSTMIQFV